MCEGAAEGGGGVKDDVDALAGQELEDAFAREVYGWTLSSGGCYWEGTLEWQDGRIQQVRMAHRKSWHPASSWQAFGFAVDDMCEKGFRVWLHTGGKCSECSVWIPTIFGGQDPLVRQLGGRNLFETGLRAFIKAVRAMAARRDGEPR